MLFLGIWGLMAKGTGKGGKGGFIGKSFYQCDRMLKMTLPKMLHPNP